MVLFIGKRFDKVFIYQTGPLTLATAGIFLKKLYKSKVTIWTQDLWPETVYAFGFKQTKFLSFCLDHFVKWIYKNCDNILVSCEGFIDRIHRYTPDKKIDFIPNWSLIDYKPKNKQDLPGSFNFTFAGNIGKVQNLDNIVFGFGQFVKKHPDAWLNIIGDGSYLQELKKIVEDRKISNVNFTGRKQLSEMSDFYEASDALIISLKDVPLYEIMIPSKFQAYLTTQKPIFSIFKGEVSSLVEKYQIGITAHPSDIEDIANGFEKFVKLPDEDRILYSKNSAKLLDGVFNRKKIINRINSLFWDV